MSGPVVVLDAGVIDRMTTNRDVAGSGVVFTTDPADLRRLLVDHSKIGVEKP